MLEVIIGCDENNPLCVPATSVHIHLSKLSSLKSQSLCMEYWVINLSDPDSDSWHSLSLVLYSLVTSTFSQLAWPAAPMDTLKLITTASFINMQHFTCKALLFLLLLFCLPPEWMVASSSTSVVIAMDDFCMVSLKPPHVYTKER